MPIFKTGDVKPGSVVPTPVTQDKEPNPRKDDDSQKEKNNDHNDSNRL